MLHWNVSSLHLERMGNEHVRVGTCSSHVGRRHMEDQHAVQLSLPSHPHISFFGVYDGHGGTEAAQFVGYQLHQRIDAMTDPFDQKELLGVIKKLDLDFLLEKEKFPDHGTTCCFALLRPFQNVNANQKAYDYELLVSNTGDSRCYVMDAAGLLKFNTRDHKPTDADERKRILEAGGSVFMGRIDGEINLSRAIGDWVYKALKKQNKDAMVIDNETVQNLENVQNDQVENENEDKIQEDVISKMICDPDFSLIGLQKGERFLLCCDGVYDCLKNDQLTLHVHNELTNQIDIGKEKAKKEAEAEGGTVTESEREKQKERENEKENGQKKNEEWSFYGAVNQPFVLNADDIKQEQFCDPADVIASLCKLSMDYGSRDNMTGILVVLQEGQTYNYGPQFIAGDIPFFGRNDDLLLTTFLDDARRFGLDEEQITNLKIAKGLAKEVENEKEVRTIKRTFEQMEIQTPAHDQPISASNENENESELGGDWSIVHMQGEYHSMVSGEEMTIALKNKDFLNLDAPSKIRMNHVEEEIAAILNSEKEQMKELEQVKEQEEPLAKKIKLDA